MGCFSGYATKRIISTMAFLVMLGVTSFAEQIPGPLVVQVHSEADNRPLAGVTVHVGGRMAVSDPAGEIVFDGIPAGAYTVLCRHPEYLRFEQQLELPEGAREPLAIALVPEVRSPVRLRLVEEKTGEPVGQAMIHLTPRDVPSALSGSLVSATDSDGNVITVPVPEGVYRLRTEAPGYSDIDADFNHTAMETPVEFRMTAMVRTASYTVTVRGPDGQPLRNATVELWEVYPRARIAAAQTDIAGVASFTELRLGSVNPIAEDDSLPVTHRAEAVVRVEAAGYATVLQSVRLRDRGQAAVTLHPMQTVQEQEPNDSLGQGPKIQPGQTASFTIGQDTDQDWFRFVLAEPGRVKLMLNDSPMEIAASVFHAAGESVAQIHKYSQREAQGQWDLPAGRYSIRVQEWGQNDCSETETLLTLSVETAADPMEPNYERSVAKPIRIGEHVRGLLFPVGDADHFTLHLDRPGCLRLESVNAPDVQRSVVIYDRAERQVAELNCYAQRGRAGEWQFAAGDYHVVITEWGNNGCSLDPYDFRFLLMTDDGIDDPAVKPGERIAAVRSLDCGSRTYATINPIRDRDLYSLSIPSSGTLHVYQHGATQLTVRLLDAHGRQLTAANSYDNRQNQLSHPFDAGMTAYLEVSEWSDNGWSPFPYELRCWFDPAGEMERLQRNDTLKTALPVELGATIRDNILPLGDHDWYQLTIDQPGLLHVWNHARPQLSVTLFNSEQEQLGLLNTYGNRTGETEWPVVPGIYYLQVTEWGNNGALPWDYVLRTGLRRAVPGETADLKQSPACVLRLDESQPCGLEHVGDIERFRVSIPSKGDYAIWIGGPLATHMEVRDLRSGRQVAEYNSYGHRTSSHPFSTEGPMELELTVTEWGNNDSSIQPNWIMVAPQGQNLLAAPVTWTVNPLEPTQVTFSIPEVPGVEAMPSLDIDVNGDGTPETTVVRGQTATANVPKQGLYRVVITGRSQECSARGECWVQATGQPVRTGLHVLVATPGEDEWIERDIPVRVTALSYEGKPVRQVTLRVDGRPAGTDYQAPYEFEVPWRSLAGGERLLVATATDVSGTQKSAERTVRVSDYFHLLPADGAVVTGNDITVSWEGGSFGSARVRYRPMSDGKADHAWRKVVGENGRARRVRLTGLEPDRVYEFQPIGGERPGPVRQVTRVRGLAFTEPRYGGTILRDYDQKIPVAVRNHAEKARVVRLRCDQPKDSLLLAEFVGDGEKGRPVELGPGEQRTFTLGFSAQDVVKEAHTLPIYIRSKDGYSDQAEVEVRVKLPQVDLEWVDVTPEDHTGLGRTLELVNHGDTLTDLEVTAAKDRISIQPQVRHGLFQAGDRLRFTVYPKLYDGFTACEDRITASSIGRRISFDYHDSLEPGETLYRLDMTAGLDPVTGEPADIADARRAARRLVGQYLSGGTVDWSRGTKAQDTDRDGKPDRWTVIDSLNQTQWFGRDTDGDGHVDFAQADVGMDGEIDHSSLLEDGKWRSTNLLDAWLEMNFSIPKHRSRYQPHDLDLIVNGRIVGQLQQTIPEGNYRFPLSPTALAWTEDGSVADNRLEIQSHFLNFAHYAISSDFQLKTRLLGTDTFMVGTSREDALKRLYESDPGFSTDEPDFSLSSEDLVITPLEDIQKGDPVTLTGTVRNLGVGTCESLQIGLFLAVPGTEGQEMERLTIAPPGMMTKKTFKFVWAAAPGSHSLRVVVDPDNLIGEMNRKNNAAIVNLAVPGDDTPPSLSVLSPEDGMVTSSGQVDLLAQATDDTGVIGVEVIVDGGAAQPLYRTGDGFAGTVQLQSGRHSLRLRAMDSGSQYAQETLQVRVKAEAPACTIVKPVDGAMIGDNETEVVVTADDVRQVGVRVNNGPWFRLRNRGESWTGRIELPFGADEIEIVALDAAGMRQTQRVTVTCTAQPEEQREEEEGQPVEEDEGIPDQQEVRPAEPQKQEPSPTTPDQKAAQHPETPNQGGDGRQVKDQTPLTDDRNQPVSPQTGNRDRRPDPGRTDTGDTPQAKTADSDTSKNTPEPKKHPVQEVEPTPEDDTPEPLDIPELNRVVPPHGATPRVRRSPAPSGPQPPAGRARRSPSGFAYNRQRSDWYCPNRPHIKVNFKLPEWLTREEFDKIIKKGPDSKEFTALEAKLLAQYWYRHFGRTVNGQTMDQLLLKYKDLLLKRCGRLDQPDGRLPGFFESLGLAAGDPPTDPRELEAWRNKMKELTEVYWLRLLATEDPATVIQGMKQRAQALGKFDEAAQMQAEAVIEEIQANQKITQDVLEALPYAGEALDVLGAVTGESLSGERLGGWERFFRAACVAGPVAMEEALKRSPRAQEAVSQLLHATGEMGSNMKNSLLKRLGVNADKFDEFAESAGKFLTKERHVFAKQADEAVEAARMGYKQTAEGLEDLRQLEKAREVSRKTVDELSDAVKRGGMPGDAGMEDIIIRMQKDKTAQSIMNSADVPPPVRKRANETIKKIYSDADVPTMQRIRQSDDIKRFAKEHGLDPDSIEVSVWNPTNKKGPLPGEPGYVDPDFVKYGRDRDVTYQITGKTADGRTVTLDVNHEISGPIYQEELYKRCHGGQLPTDPAEVERFATQMDQMVTSKWHREAYNTGPDVHIDDWLNNDITPPVARPEDIRDTIITKSDHWFHQADLAGRESAQYSRDMAEGMRQATKQWDNFVAKRAALYGADVPVQLEKAMDIFKQVERGSISPKQAEHMLAELGRVGGAPLTPQRTVEHMAHFFEGMEKGPGKAFRSIKTAELATTLDSMRDLEKKTELINEAYRSGQISGSTFRQMRQGSLKLPPSPTPQQRQELREWALSAWHRRAISATEKRLIEEQIGPVDQ